MEEKIVPYDLTDTCFEGEKRGSRKARRGGSREKRSDCPLTVSASAVNAEGFVKHSAVYEGNRADCTTPGEITEKRRAGTSRDRKKTVAVIDAGIATEENLSVIADKGYDCVCAERADSTKHEHARGGNPACVTDNRKRPIGLGEVKTEKTEDTEYCPKAGSEGNRLQGNLRAQPVPRAFRTGVAGHRKSRRQ